MKDRPEKVNQVLSILPEQPGVYQYFDDEGTIIYVGKAKSLKKRVSSYFTKDRFENGKTALLVRKIRDIRYIVVESEFDALLLENSLIKKHQPRYNIQLRDDKTYPWICIRKEHFPRIFYTRQMKKDGSEYFGPFPSVRRIKLLLELIHQTLNIRNCSHKLTPETVGDPKFKSSMEFQIGNCKGACQGLVPESNYKESLDHAKKILKGEIGSVISFLKEKMAEAAAQLDFEGAQTLKTQLEDLESFRNRSMVVSPTIHNVDVFSFLTDDKFGYVNYMKVVNGAVIQSHTVELKKKLDESDTELLIMAVLELRQRFKSSSKEVIVPFIPEIELPDIKFHIPQRGDKRKLLFLSEQNARQFMQDRHTEQEKVDPDRHVNRIMHQMQQDLRLPELPRHIECFDNSNFQGAFPVAACVVFRNGKPYKKDYRHFNIKTVEGPNDFASMEEVLHRRYKRLRDEGESLPQLIVIDGGKGQLSSAVKSLDELGLRGKISIIGIAKKLEEIFFPEDPVPIYIDKRSETLKIIQHLRNEAHRFGITHHRNQRSKGTIKTSLSDIKGIGDATAKQLLKHFKSVKRIREASEKDLIEVVGRSKGLVVYRHYNPTNETD